MDTTPRIIVVPQYPTKLRYQEWWFEEFSVYLRPYFSDVIMLGEGTVQMIEKADLGGFAPVHRAINFELEQIKEYMALEINPQDILLLNDLSFPGLFAHTLFHKKPNRCFAICHATSKNRYDYFAKQRGAKYPVEKAIGGLFKTIFVASEYHKNKLGWGNLEVVGLPNPPFKPHKSKLKARLVVSASRPNLQKVNKKLEKQIESKLKVHVERPNINSWGQYYQFLATSKFLLITSKEDTYGYQIIDALLSGCIPIAPRANSYPELLPTRLLYKDVEHAIQLINTLHWSEVEKELYPLPTVGSFYKRIAEVMLS